MKRMEPPKVKLLSREKEPKQLLQTKSKLKVSQDESATPVTYNPMAGEEDRKYDGTDRSNEDFSEQRTYNPSQVVRAGLEDVNENNE